MFGEKIKRSSVYVPVMRLYGGWKKERTKAFVINIPRHLVDPDWVLNLAHENCDPEVWLQQRRNLYTLKVPFKKSKAVIHRLKWRGFRFDKSEGMWEPRLYLKRRIYGKE